MRIAFICGSLEPGRDGVGDYTRLLARELIRQGHEAMVIAFNDNYITDNFTGFQDADGVSVPITRIIATEKPQERIFQTRSCLASFNPEWLSLQFVPWAFNFNGLPFNLGKELVRLGVGRSWHIMIHELWAGMSHEESIKHVVLGMMQRHIIKRLISSIKPKVIHTQNLVYKAQLARIGFKSQYMPLFSNIPNVRKNKYPSLSDMNPDSYHNKTVYLVIFGSIHPGAPVEQFANDALLYSQEHSCAVSLIMIGRCGNEQEHWAETWTKAGLPTQMLGEQPPEFISHVLSEASLGISTTPAALTGKSGTVAAMHEHGLSVLSVARPWQARGIPELKIPENICVYTQGNFAKYLKTKRNSSPNNKVLEVAQQLVFSLLDVNNDKKP